MAKQDAKPMVSVLTPRGRGAVATICFRGDSRLIDAAENPRFRAVNGQTVHEQPIGRICFGHWGNRVTEEVVICRTDGDTVEIHCHGGDAAVRRIVEDLQSLACDVATWQDATARTAGIFAAECADAVSRATTLRTAEVLLAQQSGILKSALEELLQVQCISLHLDQARQKLDELLRWSQFGLHLIQPWTVVLAGRPNVGKSSLINALVGYSRSIVYDQPGTTRDVVTAETALHGWPIQLADTAGLRDDAEQLESAGIELARQQLADADCRILLLDTSQPPHTDDRRLLADWPDAILVAHKSDLPDVWGEHVPKAALRISSLAGSGVATLAEQIVERLVPEVPAAGTAIPITSRQIELLRKARRAIDANDETAYREALQACLA